MSSEAYAGFRTERSKADAGRGDFSSQRPSHPNHRHRSLVLEEGGQGVLFHRKEQGLRADQVRRRCDAALAIVSKLQRLVPELWVPRG